MKNIKKAQKAKRTDVGKVMARQAWLEKCTAMGDNFGSPAQRAWSDPNGRKAASARACRDYRYEG